MLRYKVRLSLGVFFSLLVSLTNLFSITTFVPIFNVLGESGPVQLFDVGGTELAKHQAYVRGEDLPFYESLNARWTGWKIKANAEAEKRTSREVVIMLIIFILPVYLLKIIFLTLSLYCVGTAGYMAVRDIRLELYKKMNELGLDYFGRERTGIVMSRIINDAELMGKTMALELNEAIVDVFYIFTHFGLLALISWKMLLITLIVVPVLFAPVSRFADKVRKAAAGQQERLAEMGAHIREILSGIRVIRAFSMEKFERARFEVTNERLYANTFKGHYYHQVGPALTEFVATILAVGFMAWGAHEISRGFLTRGLFFAFFFTLIFIMRPIKQVSVMVNLLGAARAAAERILQMMQMPAPIQSPSEPRKLELRTSVRYRNVSFAYPGTDASALQEIDFEVKRGQNVSIVGHSGAGKSTLMDLLPRFYDVDSGAIEFDGVDIRSVGLRDLRRSIGVVTQNVFLFNATIGENIAYGDAAATREKIIEVARAANAHAFIEEFPNGYDTMIGERGVMLSGGQRQRIAIARSLLLDPPVLIFDEATSALDNESEMLVQEALERLLASRTVFVIAHRLSTVYKSDIILVLDKGRIVERGSHQELLENGRVYRKLYEMQFQEA